MPSFAPNAMPSEGFLVPGRGPAITHFLINPVLRISQQPQNVGVNPGDDAVFTANYADGVEPVLTHWQVSTDGVTWITIPGFSDTTTLTLTNVDETLNGNLYRYIAGDDIASLALSVPALLTVYNEAWVSGPLLIGAGGFITAPSFSATGI